MTSPLRVVFAGTPEFAVAPSGRLHRPGVEVAAVHTQPGSSGRPRPEAAASPVKEAARPAAIVSSSPRISVVPRRATYSPPTRPTSWSSSPGGLILSQKVLDIPRFGCWNDAVVAAALARRRTDPARRARRRRHAAVFASMQMEKRTRYRPGHRSPRSRRHLPRYGRLAA